MSHQVLRRIRAQGRRPRLMPVSQQTANRFARDLIVQETGHRMRVGVRQSRTTIGVYGLRAHFIDAMVC